MMTAADKEQAKWLLAETERALAPLGRRVRFMEVCGTHTVSIFRAGIRQLLPESIELVSGPGCPVCVTPEEYIDKAVAYAARPEVIIVTFGDMLKVPGSNGSLAAEQAKGADVRVVYSPLEALAVAAANPDKLVVFLAVGFETTAPAEAAAFVAAKQQGLDNFCLLTAPKLVPPALKMLLEDEACRPDGFLLPGHVAVVTGTAAFAFVAAEYRVPGVVAGFEPLEILRAVYELAKMVGSGEAAIRNAYPSVVKADGNETAQKLMADVFEETAAEWRGIGCLDASGLKLREEYRDFDIEARLPLTVAKSLKKSACRCGEVLKGLINPPACPLFGKACTPEMAKGPCMVSIEGVCAAWYKYGGGRYHYGR